MTEHFAYKSCLTADGEGCIVKLSIPADAVTNEGRPGVVNRDTAKFKSTKALVVSIHTFSGSKVREAFSQYDPMFKYKVGRVVISNIDGLICGEGIHYYLTPVIYFTGVASKGYTGHLTRYYDSGRIMEEGDYFHGNQEGRWIGYDETGQVCRMVFYSMGQVSDIIKP